MQLASPFVHKLHLIPSIPINKALDVIVIVIANANFNRIASLLIDVLIEFLIPQISSIIS